MTDMGDSAGQNPRGPNGKGPVFMALRDVAAIADKAERRAHLLDRLDHVWKQATERGYVNKAGDVIANPDGATQCKCIDLAAELVDAHGEDRAKRPADLSVFNGGKASPRKAG